MFFLLFNGFEFDSKECVPKRKCHNRWVRFFGPPQCFECAHTTIRPCVGVSPTFLLSEFRGQNSSLVSHLCYCSRHIVQQTRNMVSFSPAEIQTPTLSVRVQCWLFWLRYALAQDVHCVCLFPLLWFCLKEICLKDMLHSTGTDCKAAEAFQSDALMIWKCQTLFASTSLLFFATYRRETFITQR